MLRPGLEGTVQARHTAGAKNASFGMVCHVLGPCLLNPSCFCFTLALVNPDERCSPAIPRTVSSISAQTFGVQETRGLETPEGPTACRHSVLGRLESSWLFSPSSLTLGHGRNEWCFHPGLRRLICLEQHVLFGLYHL